MKKVVDAAKKAKKLKEKGEKIEAAYEKGVEANPVRISAQIAALADPTGIASTIEA